MKKVQYLLFGLFGLFGLLTIQCTKDDSTLTNERNNANSSNELKQLTSNDISNAVYAHRHGLDFVIENFNNSSIGKKYKGLKAKGEVSEKLNLETLRSIDSLSKEYIKQNKVTYNDEKVEFFDYEFSDEELLTLGGLSKSIYKSDINSVSNEYYNKIVEPYNLGYKNDELREQLASIILEAEAKLDNNQIIPLKMMSNILIDSDNIWNSNLSSKQYSARGGASIALADATGAYGAGSWGLIAGPLGAAVLAVNGALIGSSAAYIMSAI